MSSETRNKGQKPPNFRILVLVLMMMAFGVLAAVSLIILRTTQTENHSLSEHLKHTGQLGRRALHHLRRHRQPPLTHPPTPRAAPVPAESGKATLIKTLNETNQKYKELVEAVGAAGQGLEHPLPSAVWVPPLRFAAHR